MTAVAALMVAALTVAASASLVRSLVRSLIRSHARERDLLVNQILHLSGRTWTPPPADEWKAATDGEPLVASWTAAPEQQPYE